MRGRFRLSMPDLRHVDWRKLPGRARDRAGEGWYVRGDRPSQDRLRLLYYNYTANVIANLIGGSFFTGLLILINASDSFIGSMTMISTAANMLQIFTPLLLEKFQRRKKMLVAFRAILLFVNILVIGLVPVFPAGQQGRLTLMALSVLAVNLINALISPGFSIWHIKSIPPNVRNSFFSLITMTVGAVVALCNLGGSAIVDAFRARGQEFQGLLAVRLIALAIGVYDIWLLSHIEEYPYERAEKMRLRDLFVKPFQEKLYLKTVMVTFLWNLSANIPGSYYTVYLLKNLNINYSFIMICSMLNVPVVMLLTPIWSRVVRRTGWIRTLYVSMFLYLLHYVMLSFVTGGALWLYPAALLFAYVMAIGINLSFTAIPYINMPAENQTIYIGFYSTAANLAALLGVTLGKYFIEWTDGLSIWILGVEMINKQYILLLTAAMMVLASFGIRWVRKSLPAGDN